MNWRVVKSGIVLGAPYVVLDRAGHTVTVQRFQYPAGPPHHGKHRVRVGFDHVNADRAKAEAHRLCAMCLETIATLSEPGEEPLRVGAPTLEIPAAPKALVDVVGADALILVVPFFGDDLTDAILAALDSARPLVH